jgi:hypothetical protein
MSLTLVSVTCIKENEAVSMTKRKLFIEAAPFSLIQWSKFKGQQHRRKLLTGTRTPPTSVIPPVLNDGKFQCRLTVG